MEDRRSEVSTGWKKKLLFAGVFVQENRLHAILDRNLKEMTAKQWLLLVVADAFDAPPDLTQLARVLGCSRQNIKKLAASLEKAGYVTLRGGAGDGRSLCVEITDRGKVVIGNSRDLEDKVHGALFRDFSGDEIDEYFRLSGKMMNGFGYLEALFREVLRDEGADAGEKE